MLSLSERWWTISRALHFPGKGCAVIAAAGKPSSAAETSRYPPEYMAISRSRSSRVIAALPFRPGRECSQHFDLARCRMVALTGHCPGAGCLPAAAAPPFHVRAIRPRRCMALSRTAVRLLAVSVALSAAVGEGAQDVAQITGHPLESSGGAGIFAPDARASVKKGPAYKGAIGYRFLPAFTLEGQATFAPSKADTGS